MNPPGSDSPRKVPKARRMIRSASARSLSRSGRTVTADVMTDHLGRGRSLSGLPTVTVGNPLGPRRSGRSGGITLAVRGGAGRPPVETQEGDADLPRDPRALLPAAAGEPLDVG